MRPADPAAILGAVARVDMKLLPVSSSPRGRRFSARASCWLAVLRLVVGVDGPPDGLQFPLYAVQVSRGGKFVSDPRDCHTDIDGVDGQLAAICQLPGDCGYLVVRQSTPQQRQQRDVISFGNAVWVTCPNERDHLGHQITQTHLYPST